MPRMRHFLFAGNFLFSIAAAITLYQNSTIIETVLGEHAVSLVYAGSAALTIFFLSHSGKLLRHAGNQTFFLLYGTTYALSLLLLALPGTPLIRLISFVGYLVSGNMIIFSFNVFFERLTIMRERGTARGTYLLLGSLGILVGPMIGSLIVSSSAGYQGAYLASLALFATAAIVVSRGIHAYEDAEYKPIASGALKRTLRDNRFRMVIIANFILNFFFVWMIIYTPIYLYEYLHLSWDTIGIIFTIMLTPFVFLDYPLGRIADKLGSEKELAAIGFLIMIACVFGIAFLPDLGVIDITILLFLSRVGAATVEAMTDIHFFKVADDSDADALSAFSELRPYSYIIAPLVAFILLYFVPFRAIFGILGFVLIVGFYASFKLEDTGKWWVRSHE